MRYMNYKLDRYMNSRDTWTQINEIPERKLPIKFFFPHFRWSINTHKYNTFVKIAKRMNNLKNSGKDVNCPFDIDFQLIRYVVRSLALVRIGQIRSTQGWRKPPNSSPLILPKSHSKNSSSNQQIVGDPPPPTFHTPFFRLISCH